MKNSKEEKVVQILYQNIFAILELLIEIVIDQGLQFTPNIIETHMNLYKIQHNRLVTYHSQENSQVEMTNKELENIITKTIKKHRRDLETRFT